MTATRFRQPVRQADQKLPEITPASPDRFLTVDLGQSNDYTAITAITPVGRPDPTYEVGFIERVELNTRYTTIRDHVIELANMLSVPEEGKEPEPIRLPGAGIMREIVKPRVFLLLDFTGVGTPVADMFMEAQEGGFGKLKLDPDVTIIPVTITGGPKVSRDERSLKIPKRELASVVQVVLQEDRLILDSEDPMSQIMANELIGFRATITASGHDSYGASEDWRSGNPGNHDDLVLSMALGLWWGENTGTR